MTTIDGTIEFISQVYSNMFVIFYSFHPAVSCLGSSSPVQNPSKFFFPMRAPLIRRNQLRYVIGPSSFRSTHGRSNFTNCGCIETSTPFDILMNSNNVFTSAGSSFAISFYIDLPCSPINPTLDLFTLSKNNQSPIFLFPIRSKNSTTFFLFFFFFFN
jgi:hypothetical protein